MSTVTEDLTQTPVETPVGAPAPAAPRTPTPTLPPQEEERPLTKEEIMRPALGALMTTLGCAFLVGGMFTGFAPRFYAAGGGIIGVLMAVWAARATKRESLIQGLSLAGILLAGLIALGIGGGFGAISNLGATIADAAENARLNRPPAPFLPGWYAIVPWTVGMIGYAAAWVGSVGRKPAVGLLVPIPVIAFAAIAQPDEAQVAAGIVAFVALAVGLAIIYRADRGEGEGVSTAYELKRAARTAPLVVVLIVALVALSRTNLLFPDPLYDPTQRAQLPKAVPLTGVTDRVLFETQGDFTGPWRTGILSVYDGEAWRLPPFAESDFQPVPLDGLLGPVFDNPVPPQVRARVTVRGLEGVVLPMPARINAIKVDNAPPLVTDTLAQTVRIDQGQVSDGLAYDVAFALLPTEDQLRAAGPVTDPDILADYLDTAGLEAPPAVKALLARAPRSNLWDRLDFMRKTLLDTVTATGQGLPEPVPPSKVNDMLDGSKEASPYEIVAAQALIARWAGVPARIGYGFDRGNDTGAIHEFRPKHGAAWLEVYFQGNGWFPITGLPKHAKQSLGDSDTQLDAEVLPSDDIAVQLFLPLRVSPSALLFKQLQKIVLLALPFIILGLLIWLLWPILVKARRRARRTEWALEMGRSARIGVAYAEFRDLATDLGVGDPYATPLAYLDMVVPDDEHAELAWLVTRCLWGDLRESVGDDEVYAAEELSRSLRRRIFEAQPFTIRGISLVSRLSLRNPYAPELMSPPIAHVTIGGLARKAFNAVSPAGLKARRKKKEIRDEAVGSA